MTRLVVSSVRRRLDPRGVPNLNRYGQSCGTVFLAENNNGTAEARTNEMGLNW